MDISEIRDRKTKLENEILEFLQVRVGEFQALTGEQPYDISISFNGLMFVGQINQRRVIDRVDVRVFL